MTRMPEMSDAQLPAAMRDHRARMQRLMDMQRTMTPPTPE
jgi:hypothetical protein